MGGCVLVTVPAVFLQTFGLVGAVEEFAFEELNGDNSKDEHKEDVDDEDVQDVLQRVHNAVEHSLKTTDKNRQSGMSVQLHKASRNNI